MMEKPEELNIFLKEALKYIKSENNKDVYQFNQPDFVPSFAAPKAGYFKRWND